MAKKMILPFELGRSSAGRPVTQATEIDDSSGVSQQEVNELVKGGFINVTRQYDLGVSDLVDVLDAIASDPKEGITTPGVIITFLTDEGWKTKQYQGGDLDDPESWKDIDTSEILERVISENNSHHSARFDYVVEGEINFEDERLVNVPTMSYVVWCKNYGVFALRTGTSQSNYKYYQEWEGEEPYHEGGLPHLDKLYICGKHLYMYDTDNNKLVEVGGTGTSGQVGVFDISAYTDSAYDNLTAALGTNGANVPEGIRAGGMQVKYLENVLADYGVKVTEGLTTEPTGTLLESAPTITDGTYKAAQLSAFATLPANPYNSVTYYIGVTEDETTTYTSWVITKKTNDSTKYVQCRLMSAAWSVNVNDWQIDVMHELDEMAGETKLISIPFDVNKRLINSDGTLGSNNSWKGTAYVPVNAGEEWYYSGLSGTSMSVYGYSYDGSTYTPKRLLVNKTTSLVKNSYFVIPNNVTHIVASCKTSDISNAALTRYKDSYLGELMKVLGDVRRVEVLSTASWTNGRYVGANGTWYTSNSFGYMFLDVVAGQTIYLRSIGTRDNVATIAKKITDTKNEVLYIPDSSAYRNVTFEIKEDMTIVISSGSAPNAIILITEKFKRIDNQIEVLQEKQVADKAEHLWQAQYDLKLGYMFNGIAVIGDSMSVGSISTQDVSEPNSNLGASWLSVLAKRWGCIKRQHYARGGTTSYSWLNNTEYGLGKMLNDANVYNAYFIAYAHNDAGSSSISSVGAATDTAATVTISGTTPSCASGNTFCAYYKAIIDQIRTKAPHAMIFLMSSYDNVVRNNSSHRNAIKNIASWYYEQGDHLVYALDTGGVPDSEMSLGGHYSTQGYFHIAMRADQEANKVIYEHMDDMQIKEFGFYNNVNASYSEIEVNT